VARWKLPSKAEKSFSSPQNFPFMSVRKEKKREAKEKLFRLDSLSWWEKINF
jgi:hypothetical protein